MLSISGSCDGYFWDSVRHLEVEDDWMAPEDWRHVPGEFGGRELYVKHESGPVPDWLKTKAEA